MINRYRKWCVLDRHHRNDRKAALAGVSPVQRRRTVTIPHEPGTPHYPEDPDWMEARLIEEIVQIQAALGR